MTYESLAIVAARVRQAQDALGRPILVENPAADLGFTTFAWSGPEFLATLCRATGCGLLLDVNNLFVTCANPGHDPASYLEAIPASIVKELHLAGRMGRDCPAARQAPRRGAPRRTATGQGRRAPMTTSLAESQRRFATFVLGTDDHVLRLCLYASGC
jgi:hypothetical protein